MPAVLFAATSPAWLSDMRQLRLEAIGDADLVVLCHLRVDRKQNRMILRELRLSQIMALFVARIRRLAMRAHDTTTRCDSLIEQTLHHRFLINPLRQPHAITLPIGTRPFWFKRQTQSFDISQQLSILTRRARDERARYPAIARAAFAPRRPGCPSFDN